MHYQVGKRTKIKGKIGIYVYRSKGTVDGKPKLSYYYTIPGGKPILVGHSWEGCTIEAAVEARADFMRKRRHGENIIDPQKAKTTVTDGFKEFIEHSRAQKNTSVHVERSAWKNHIKPVIGHLPINSVRELDVERVLRRAGNKGLATSTLGGVLSTVRNLFRYLIKAGYTHSNPAEYVKTKRNAKKRNRKRYLKEHEITTLYEAIEFQIKTRPTRRRVWQETKAQVYLGLEMGLRSSEVWTDTRKLVDSQRDYSLRWENIDWRTGTVHITGKGLKERDVELTRGVISALTDLGIKKRGKVFAKYQHKSIKWLFTNLGFNDGLESYRKNTTQWVVFHTLRHTFATYLTRTKKDLQLTAEILGHTMTEVTVMYAHLLEGETKKAMSEMGDFFGGLREKKGEVVPFPTLPKASSM